MVDLTALRSELQRLKELEKKATPGPWEKEMHTSPTDGRSDYSIEAPAAYKLPPDQHGYRWNKGIAGWVASGANADLMISFRNYSPKLLRVLEAAADLAEKVEKFLEMFPAEEPGSKRWAMNEKLQAFSKALGEEGE